MFKKVRLLKLFLPLTLCFSLIFPAFSVNAALVEEKRIEENANFSSSSKIKILDEGNWAPATRLAINNLIIKNGKGSKTYKSNQKPYVVFDWDNTNCYADTEESTLIYQLENLKYKMTPEQFRIAFTTGNNQVIPETDFVAPYYNDAGQPVNIAKIANDVCKDYQFFWDNYKGLNPKATGKTLADIQKTDEFKDFEAKFWFTYSAMDSTFGYDISWTWLLNFFTGYKPEEVKTLATQAIDYAAGQKIQNVYFDSTLPGETGIIKNSNSSIGNYFRQGLRSTPEMKNLMNTLRSNGIDVYISTASLDSVVRGFASTAKYGYNVPDENVIGMRLNLDANKKYVSIIPDPTTYAINAKHGKAVNINNLLAQKKGYNPIMIAGDSDGDYEMMTELSGLNNGKMINNFAPLQMILIVNRLKGGTLGELCKAAVSQMGLPNQTIVLQGRNENTGSWVPYESTVKLGKVTYQLLK